MVRAILIRGLVLIALAYGSYQQYPVWQSEVALWTQAAHAAPLKPRPWLNLAVARADVRDFEGACQALTHAELALNETAEFRSPYTRRLVPAAVQGRRAQWGCPNYTFLQMVIGQLDWPYLTGVFDWKPVLMPAGYLYEDATWRMSVFEPNFIETLPLTPRTITQLSYNLVGDNGTGQRVINVLLHSINAGLVALLAFWLTGSLAASFMAGSIFLLHPLQSEAVWYLSARSDLLMTTGILGAMVATVDPAWTPWHYPWAVLCGLLALGSKEAGIAIFGLLPLVVWMTRKDWQRAAWPLVSYLVALACARHALQSYLAMLVSPETTQPPIGAAAYQAVGLWRLVRLSLLPMGLTVDADLDLVPHALALVALGAVFAAVALAWRYRHRARLASFSVFAVGLAVLPRFIVRLSPEVLNAHQFYLPMVFVSLIMGTLLVSLTAAHPWRTVIFASEPGDEPLVMRVPFPSLLNGVSSCQN